MNKLINAFEPFDWNKKEFECFGDEETAKKAYETTVSNLASTGISANTPYGEKLLNDIFECITSENKFSVAMLKALKENMNNIVIVRSTDLLSGYVCVSQLNGSVKYYFNSKAFDKSVRNAEDIVKYMLDKLQCIPLYMEVVKLADLIDEKSYKFELISKVLKYGSNKDLWSSEIEEQLTTALGNLEHEPNASKYYFITKGKYGWYLKSDKEKNKAIKERALKARSIKEVHNSEDTDTNKEADTDNESEELDS